MFLAAQYGYARIAKLLLTYGAEPDRLREDGTTPLLFAAYYGHAKVVALLLAAGADRSIAYRGLRPLIGQPKTGTVQGDCRIAFRKGFSQ